MNRIVSAVAAYALLTALFGGCATTPQPRQSALQGEGILTALRGLVKNYEARDRDAFLEGLSLKYPAREEFSQALAGVFAEYQTARVRIQYPKMVITIDDRGARLISTWDSELRTEGGKIVKDGARSTFLFDPGTFKLLGIEGKNPFVPQAAADK